MKNLATYDHWKPYNKNIKQQKRIHMQYFLINISKYKQY